MKIDWKLLVIILFEIVIIFSLSLVARSALLSFWPDMDLFLLTVLSLGCGYVMSWAVHFIIGVILGLTAHFMLNDEQLDNFYKKYLRNTENDDDEEFYEQDDNLEEEQDKQITVYGAQLDEVSENKVGTYLEKEIPEWIMVNGQKYNFSHVLTKNSLGQFELIDADLQTDDVIYQPGLVFRKAT